MSAKEPKQSGASFLRSLRVLEAIARAERPLAAVELIHLLALPKPTAHRIVAMLERSGLVQRDPVAKRLIVGARLGALALEVMQRSSQHGPRHQILSRLTADTRETSTFTVLDRDRVLLVDRVESAWPLRVDLYPGLHVPLHCTASGKLLLATMPDAARERLLESLAPLRAYTPNSTVKPARLAAMLNRIRSEAVSTDNEEFMAGLVAIAVPVRHPVGEQTIGTVSLNAPAARMTVKRARHFLPALRRAALALSATFGSEPKVRVVARGAPKGG